jgi:signal peptidase I
VFTPSHLKQAKLLLEGAQKFIHFKRDILKPEKLAEIEALKAQFAQAVKEKASREVLEPLAKELSDTCERSVVQVEDPGTRDWVESLVTCAIIVFAIRAYFLQPFKIPTGSMQPTLNGLITEQTNDPAPNLVVGLWDNLTRGRSAVQVIAPCDGTVIQVQQTSLLLLTYSTITYDTGGSLETQRVWAPARQLCGISQDGMSAFPGEEGVWTHSRRLVPSSGYQTQASSYTLFKPVSQTDERTFVKVKKGDIIASGRVDSGDMVLVDKISYHFRRPHRGEVFVFNTKDIRGIQNNTPIEEGSYHYIKRLAGIPGDRISVTHPNLYHNGNLAQEPGFKRVMSEKDGYRGYSDDQNMGRYGYDPKRPNYVPSKFPNIPTELKNTPEVREYFAMGDNSLNSSDSRVWGPVPEENLVGPGLFALWPFRTGHWGLIK